ncbi:MAG: PAS domain-containing protein [Cytophagales bacterium]|nr:PAS domain-containing protein [Cytophagales bacterium]
MEKEFKTLRGNTFWGSMAGRKFTTGTKTLNLLRLTDISFRKKAEEDLRVSDERLLLALESANLGIWDWDIKLNRIVWDDHMLGIYGIKKEEFSQTYEAWQKFIHQDDRKRIHQEMTEAMASGQALQTEFRIVTGASEEKTVRANARLYSSGQGAALRLIGVNWDITTSKNFEKQLIQAKDLAESASRAKAQFLSTMSHEIRTPMNAVIGITHLLLDNEPRPDQITNLKTLRFSAENLLVLINDILDFSKIEAGKIEIESIDFDLTQLVEGIKHSMQFKAEEKGLSLEVNLDPEIPQTLVGDPTRLSQVLNNLMSNAVKFTEKGLVRLEVRKRRIFGDKVELHFAIQDTGIGIPPDKIALVFESFAQASSDTTRKYGGTGLGLSITKKLLELMGSEIQVQSKPGEGTLFHFVIPFGASTISTPPTAPSRSSDSGSQTASSLEGVHVLLVEDNPVNVLVAKQFLKSGKWKLTWPKTGASLLKKPLKTSMT